MPHIPAQYAECSIYLYQSEADAFEGRGPGGSGFLVHVPSRAIRPAGYVYAVTNQHVLDGGCLFVRLNHKNGGVDVIETKRDEWFRDLGGNDVEVRPMELGANFKWWSVSTHDFLAREMINAYDIGYGDEVFLVGRLTTHSGRQKNAVAIRYGNISLMADPAEPIECERRPPQEGFLVDCRSLSGNSGSAAFVSTRREYRGKELERVIETHDKRMQLDNPEPMPEQKPGGLVVKPLALSGLFGPWLLGIDWGHMPLWTRVYDGARRKTELEVEANTGIACILPAWHIWNTLCREELLKDREETERKVEDERKRQRGDAAVNDLLTKEEFEATLNKVTRKVEQK